jgi:hypothetical protein
MSTKQQAVEEMILVGEQMSNLCCNLGQRPDGPIGNRNAECMRELQRQWDSAVREYRRKVAKKGRE